MLRNRKRQSLQVGLVTKSLLACLYVGAVGLGYVWNKNQIIRLGDDLKRREAELASFEKRNAMLAAQLAQLQSPSYLEARNQQFQLGLVAPRQEQMVRLYEPGPEWDQKLAGPAPVPLAAAAAPAKPARKRSPEMLVRR